MHWPHRQRQDCKRRSIHATHPARDHHHPGNEFRASCAAARHGAYAFAGLQAPSTLRRRCAPTKRAPGALPLATARRGMCPGCLLSAPIHQTSKLPLPGKNKPRAHAAARALDRARTFVPE